MKLLFTDGPTSHVLQWNNYVGSNYSTFNIMQPMNHAIYYELVQIGQVAATPRL